jgi:hypothetical protein
MSADELFKTKWMKSVTKMPVSLLIDLVSRLHQAGPRDSLLEPLDWEMDEQMERSAVVCKPIWHN